MALTPNYSYNLPTVGGDLDTWGGLLNANWTKADTKLKEHSDKIASLESTRQTIAQVINLIYPIGSVYISTKIANPSTFLPGTTWVAKAQGRAIVGVGTADGVLWGINEAKGVANVTLTIAQIPAHVHQVDVPAFSFTSSGQSVTHTHAVSQTPHSHTLTDPGHAHPYTDTGHVHGYPDVQGNNGTNDTGISYDAGPYRFRETWRDTNPAGIGITIQPVLSNITIANNNANITIGNASADHTHTVSGNIAPFNAVTAGGGTSHTNIQPSIGLYIWERTA